MLDIFFMCFLFFCSFLLVVSNHVFDFNIEIFDLFCFLFAFSFKSCNLLIHVNFLLFGHQSFSHTESYSTFIKSLVSNNSLLDLVSDSHKKKSSFSTVNCDLPNQFIKTLCIKFFSFWTNTCFSRLFFLKFVF